MSQSVIPQPVPPPTVEGLVSQANIVAAWEKVRKNGGAPGVDGVTIPALSQQFAQEWARTRETIVSGCWQPQPVRAVDIPKPSGGTRTLGIPTVMDRVVQQALAQVIAPLWERGFSSSSYAYRPGRGAHQAVLAAQQVIASGREWVVDLDIEKFFDHVHHSRLLDRLAGRVQDEAMMALVHRCLEAGSVRGGFRLPAVEGTPQGSPLSPLLSNIVLDEFDQHLDTLQQPFARYADDIILFCPSEAAATERLEEARKFLAAQLDLQLNPDKTGIRSPDKLTFLGFTFASDGTGTWKRAIAPTSLEAFRLHVDELVETAHGQSRSFDHVTQSITGYLQSWERYYRLVESPNLGKKLRTIARTAVRRFLWVSWGTPERRTSELVQRGVSLECARQFVQTCSDASAAATSAVMGNAVPNSALAAHGLDEPAATSAVPYAVQGKIKSAAPAPKPAFAKAPVPKPTIPSSTPPLGHRTPVPVERSPALATGKDIGAHIGFCLCLGVFGSLKGAVDLRWPWRSEAASTTQQQSTHAP